MEKLNYHAEYLEHNQGIGVGRMFKEATDYLDENAISPDDFVEIYGQDTVDADKKKAVAIKERMLEKQKMSKGMKLATVLEAAVTENITKNDWLGENTEARPAAFFDDLENGIDTLTIFRKEGGFEKYMGLVMDATSNPNKELRVKFNEIRGGIVKGTLGTMKYFKSGKVKGKMTQIPKVVVGMGRETIKELGRLKAEGKEREISAHPAQFQILEEIEMQLKIFAEYAKSQPNDIYYKESDKDLRSELVEIYEDAHDLIVEILKQRRTTVGDTGKRDEMFGRIRREAGKLLTRKRN